MIVIIVIVMSAMLFLRPDGLFRIMLNTFNLLFTIPLVVFGIGTCVWVTAMIFGSAELTVNSYLVYTVLCGTVPGLLTAKLLLY